MVCIAHTMSNFLTRVDVSCLALTISSYELDVCIHVSTHNTNGCYRDTSIAMGMYVTPMATTMHKLKAVSTSIPIQLCVCAFGPEGISFLLTELYGFSLVGALFFLGFSFVGVLLFRVLPFPLGLLLLKGLFLGIYMHMYK